jgi:hypothetical protein
MEKMEALILTRLVTAAFIMNLTYMARTHPESPCTIAFEDEEWRIRVARRMERKKS